MIQEINFHPAVYNNIPFMAFTNSLPGHLYHYSVDKHVNGCKMNS